MPIVVLSYAVLILFIRGALGESGLFSSVFQIEFEAPIHPPLIAYLVLQQICNSSQSVTPLSLVLLAHRLKFSDTEATIPETHFSVFIFLCCWNIWKHRNRVVFDVAEPSLQTLLCSCRDEAWVWAWRMPRTDIANLA